MPLQKAIDAPPAGHVDDHELMRAVAGGSETALRTLMRRYMSLALRLALRMQFSMAQAEDIAQEAFIRVWKTAHQWLDAEAGGAQFTTWLYRVVTNLCIDEKRRRQMVTLDDDTAHAVVDAALAADRRMIDAERDRILRTALQNLPERQRIAFVLTFFEERPNAETAEILGITVKAVESLLVRARRQLREELTPLLKGEKI